MANKIAAARRASKMTVEHAADLAGITAQTLVAREKTLASGVSASWLASTRDLMEPVVSCFGLVLMKFF